MNQQYHEPKEICTLCDKRVVKGLNFVENNNTIDKQRLAHLVKEHNFLSELRDNPDNEYCLKQLKQLKRNSGKYFK